MKRSDVLSMFDQLLELPAGTVRGDEELSSFENWDSLAVVTLIAQIHVETGRTLEAKAVKGCTNVAQLVRLIEPLALTG